MCEKAIDVSCFETGMPSADIYLCRKIANKIVVEVRRRLFSNQINFFS
jgi:hypothetical protein